MSKRLTQVEVEVNVKVKHGGDISVIGEYVNNRSPLHCVCNICGHMWFPNYLNLIGGSRCPECSKKKSANMRRFTSEYVALKVEDIHDGHIHIIGEYQNSHAPLLCGCNICEYEWFPRFSDLQNGHGCPNCIGRVKHAQEEVVRMVDQLSNGNIKVVGLYTGASDHLECRCTVCNHVWNSRFDSIKKGCGCPNCANINTESTGIKEIKQYLKFQNIVYTIEKKYKDLVNKRPLAYDIYIPSLNTLIEYDGQQHYEYSPNFFHKKGYWQFEDQQRRDEIKNQYAFDNNITLIRVRYDVDDIGEYLNSKLGLDY